MPPEFYYGAEDEKAMRSGNTGLILGIAGGVVVLGVAGYFLLKRKK
jgi:LPXTG-motif cell wall-anchored protein